MPWPWQKKQARLLLQQLAQDEPPEEVQARRARKIREEYLRSWEQALRDPQATGEAECSVLGCNKTTPLPLPNPWLVHRGLCEIRVQCPSHRIPLRLKIRAWIRSKILRRGPLLLIAPMDKPCGMGLGPRLVLHRPGNPTIVLPLRPAKSPFRMVRVGERFEARFDDSALREIP